MWLCRDGVVRVYSDQIISKTKGPSPSAEGTQFSFSIRVLVLVLVLRRRWVEDGPRLSGSPPRAVAVAVAVVVAVAVLLLLFFLFPSLFLWSIVHNFGYDDD